MHPCCENDAIIAMENSIVSPQNDLPPSLALSHRLAQLVAYVKLVEVLHSSLSLNGRCTDVAVDDEAAGDDGYDG